MTKLRNSRTAIAVVLALTLLAGVVMAVRAVDQHRTAPRSSPTSTTATACSPATTSASSACRSAGSTKIEPQPDGVKITFWFDRKYKVPADAKAAILSPQLVTGRAIQLTPGLHRRTGAARTARSYPATAPRCRSSGTTSAFNCKRLTELLQPDRTGRGEHAGLVHQHHRRQSARAGRRNIRETIIKLSQAMSALGDHSNDIFSTLKNLSILVSALQDSSDLLGQLNQNLASVTGLLANDPGKVGDAFVDLNAVIGDVKDFVAENRETIGTTSDKLASISTALNESLDDIKQTLHIAPSTVQNFNNIYEPANGALTGALAVNNFANPISFLCGAIQAASRLDAEQSSKLCVQYLAPIIKNRQYNFPPDRREPPRRRHRPGPTRSPTARTGCARTSCRRPARRPRNAPAPQPAPGPLAAETTPTVDDQPDRRTDRNDDSPCRRWFMMRRRWYRRAITVAVIVALAGGSSGCDLETGRD